MSQNWGSPAVPAAFQGVLELEPIGAGGQRRCRQADRLTGNVEAIGIGEEERVDRSSRAGSQYHAACARGAVSGSTNPPMRCIARRHPRDVIRAGHGRRAGQTNEFATMSPEDRSRASRLPAVDGAVQRTIGIEDCRWDAGAANTEPSRSAAAISLRVKHCITSAISHE